MPSGYYPAPAALANIQYPGVNDGISPIGIAGGHAGPEGVLRPVVPDRENQSFLLLWQVHGLVLLLPGVEGSVVQLLKQPRHTAVLGPESSALVVFAQVSYDKLVILHANSHSGAHLQLELRLEERCGQAFVRFVKFGGNHRAFGIQGEVSVPVPLTHPGNSIGDRSELIHRLPPLPQRPEWRNTNRLHPERRR